jgi:hypothetical protein
MPINDWQATVSYNQSQSPATVGQDGNYLKSELTRLQGNSMKILSPVLPAEYESIYTIKANLSGNKTSDVQINVDLYSANMSLLKELVTKVDNATFGWNYKHFNFEPIQEAKYFRIQVSYGLEDNKTTQSTIWLDYINVIGRNYTLKTTGLDDLFNDALRALP